MLPVLDFPYHPVLELRHLLFKNRNSSCIGLLGAGIYGGGKVLLLALIYSLMSL